MQIGSHVLSKKEEIKIFEIYNKFRQAFRNCKLVERKNIVGIGEEGRHLMCYFTCSNSSMWIKFKNIDQRFIIFDNSIDENIDKTIELFQNKEFLLGKTSKDSKAFLSKESKYFNMPLEVVSEEFEKFKCDLGASFDIVSFDDCSTRLRNVL